MRAQRVWPGGQPLVPCAQREVLRRLAYALRRLVDRGLDSRTIAAELHGLALGWRPQSPPRSSQPPSRGETAPRGPGRPRTRPSSLCAARRGRSGSHPGSPGAEPVRTDGDRRHARLYGSDRWRETAAHYGIDPDDAPDLYGTRLCAYTVGRDARA